AFAALDVVQPLIEFVVAFGLPGGRHGKTVEIGQVIHECLNSMTDIGPGWRQAGPGREVLQGPRTHQHLSMHEQEIFSGAVTVPMLAPRITFLTQRTGLPAERAQPLATRLVQPVPAIAAGMPEL